MDAVEIDNSCRTDFENKLAGENADNYELLKTAGSDKHTGKRNRFSGLQLTEPLRSVEDMIRVIKAGKAELFSD